ncbi:hypothetical protein ISN45_Aa07g031920 [Arabidopsis thaliana x Arabidopsis arenosa]|uniref:DUF1985 domain-containing protein n=1 Tax=Arabidopsis thaliana x Arabidopsis arenosa TaxID=1240361 RepID=A0A8T1Y9A7_9BRAS|nr:hypothetical protein ISN45_Aa07g031920 [Arabidopsis thaliana x Arabidopsis arenosa]
MAITRGGASSSGSEPSCELRSPKRRKQSDPKHSEIVVVVDDVVEDQGDKPSSANDVSEHEETQMDMEEDSLPLQPERFFFSPDDYAGEEQGAGYVAVFLRNTSTEKKKVCWFVVNGVPIRYSIRAHALITGFDCHEYATDFNVESFGSYEFVERVFGTRQVKVFAFECIPELSKRFQIVVRGTEVHCPLMCKRKFKEPGMSSFPLEELNDALGTTKDIIIILKPLAGEEALLLGIMERAEVEDSIDPIDNAWNNRLDVEQKTSHREEPQQDVPAASQKEEELLLPYLVKRMVKTAVAEAMKDVYKRLEKLERTSETRKDGEEAETSEKTQDLRTEWDDAGVGGCFEKNGDDTFDDETCFEQNVEPVFEKNVESGFKKNVEPAVGGDDTVDDESVGGQKTGGDDAAGLQMVGKKESGGGDC